MISEKETWCLEYSELQGFYHISTKTEMLKNIAICKERNIQNGYELVSEHGSRELAEEAMKADMAKRGVLNQKQTA